jgi:peptidoglycan hydrolase FlgJ
MKIGSEIAGMSDAAVATQKQAKLVDAAQQFEASMLQELLKPMRSGEDSWGGDEKNEDGASDTISSYGTEAMAKAISKGGGFGIAKQVIAQVTLEHQQAEKKKTSGY